jgi:Uma2 family endonuclease
VADATWRFDRERKGRTYARAGIPEYWIVNLEAGTLEVYHDPAGDRYSTERALQPEEEVSPLGRPEVRIRVADLLP